MCGNVVGEIGEVYAWKFKLYLESNGKLMDYLRLEKNYFSSTVEDKLLGREDIAETGNMEKAVRKLIK